MLDSNWLIAKLLKTPWLDGINLNSARINSKSIQIFFHVKSNWLRNLLFLFNFIHFLSLFNFSFLKIWDFLNLPFIFNLFLCLLNRNEKIACLDVEENTLVYTHQDIESAVTF